MHPATCLVCLLGLGPLLPAAEPSRPKVKAFVQQVVLGTEYGDGKNAVARWTAAPTLSVFGATPEQKAVVVEVISHINPVLKDHVGEIRLLADNSDAARMKVYFLPYKDFATTAARHKASYTPGNIGYFWMFWDEKWALTSTGVLLASDRLSGPRLKHFAYEEIVQSLGLARDSDAFPASIFYQKGSDGGSAPQPSALDLRLLKWTYQHLSPGDNANTVSAKFDATWGK